MKFDITRAWKDEAYRQGLSREQLATLPANPVGELSDADLANVSGDGIGGPDGFGNFASFTGFANIHNESLTVASCEVNVFSTAQTAAAPILSLITQSCIKG